MNNTKNLALIDPYPELTAYFQKLAERARVNNKRDVESPAQKGESEKVLTVR